VKKKANKGFAHRAARMAFFQRKTKKGSHIAEKVYESFFCFFSVKTVLILTKGVHFHSLKIGNKDPKSSARRGKFI